MARGRGISKELFRELNRLKASRELRRNVDYFRAQYFVARRQKASAMESLKEELRYFPDNEPAQQQLRELQAQGAAHPTGEEFEELLRVTRAFTMVGEPRLRAVAGGLTPRAVLEKFSAVQMVDVHLPTTDGREVILTRHTQPEKELQVLLEQLKLTLPEQAPPKITVAPLAL